MTVRRLDEVYSVGPHTRGDLTTDGRRGVTGQVGKFLDFDPF
jgi:hypothetical protein